VAGEVGVLALQGAFREHRRALADVGLDAVEVRRASQLDRLAGLVIPGGESTTMGKLMVEYGLVDAVRRRHAAGMPVFGTCAGMIVCARSAVDGVPGQPQLGLIDIDVRRNAFGRQVRSFEAPVELDGESDPMPGVFIRAPGIARTGPGVQVVGTLDGAPVAARQGTVLVSAFHPELTDDRRLHRAFASMVRAGSGEEAA
jgi:pyridoxal 5'-phosphate synthase pdxT subunit